MSSPTSSGRSRPLSRLSPSPYTYVTSLSLASWHTGHSLRVGSPTCWAARINSGWASQMWVHEGSRAGAFPPRRLAHVLGGPHQLGMGIADVGPRGESGPDLVDQGALGERIVHRREQRAAAPPDPGAVS